MIPESVELTLFPFCNPESSLGLCGPEFTLIMVDCVSSTEMALSALLDFQFTVGWKNEIVVFPKKAVSVKD